MVARTDARIAKYAADLDGLVGRFAWINPLQVFFDRETRRQIPKNDMDTVREVVAVIPAGSSGAKRACFQMINHPDMEYLDGIVRVGGDGRPVVERVDANGDMQLLANIWRGSRFTNMDPKTLRTRHPVEWLALIDWMITCPQYREWFIDWVAFGFQFPHLRRMTIPVFVGGQGIGKDVILLALRDLYGFNNVTTLEAGAVGKEFNAWAQNDLVILTELKFGADGKAYNAVKGLLANDEDWVTINPKYGRHHQARVSFSMISSTNNLDSLQGLEPDDRRFHPHLSEAKVNTKDFYETNAKGSCTDEALEGLLDFLLKRDLSNFTATTPAPGSGAAKTIMATDNLTGAALWAFQSVEDGGQGRFEGRNLLTLAEVETAALAEPSRRISGNVDARFLAKGLRTAGWISLGQVGPTNSRVSVWASPAVAWLLEASGKKDVWAVYQTEKMAADANNLKNI